MSNSLIDVISGGSVRWVTTDPVFYALSLVNSDVINEHLSWKHQMLVIRLLEIKSHSKIENKVL